MVFQKKGGAKTKQAAKKNKVEINDDFDMDIEGAVSDDYESDSDDQTETKTPTKMPAAKTPKGKQPQSDKVSFQIPGKNTPAKTPKSENSLVGKKLTPAKMSLKEFQGIQTKATENGKQKQSLAEDDDDDDDDDDDEDEKDFDMLMGGDDDDDGDEDDDDDDEDDDDQEEEDSLNKQTAKQSRDIKTSPLGKNKTPVKNAEKALTKKGEKTPLNSENKKNNKTPAKAPENLKTTPPKKTPANFEGFKKALELEAERRRETDRRTLYLGNLPQDITATELKALSTDIVNVNVPHASKKRKSMFAFLEFNSEEKAEENYNSLQKKKLRNVPVSVDYAGEKSRNKKNSKDSTDNQMNLKKLYVPSLPVDVTIAQIAGFFPKAFQISLNDSSSHRTASINYFTEESAAADLEACKSAVFDGKSLTVLYSVLREDKSKKNKRKRNKSRSSQKAKKIKLQKNVDDDDDDDEED